MAGSTISVSQINQSDLSGFVIPIAQSIFTGNSGAFSAIFYPLVLNPSGYQVSGAFASPTDLNSAVTQTLAYVAQNFVSLSQYSGGGGTGTGAFYPLYSNPSGYITTGQTGSFGASGSFYPLSSNPSGYITTGQTGAFGSSGNFYPLNSNPSGYITTGQTGAFGSSGSFYPLLTNPSGYITSGQTGIFITVSQTGIFVTTGQTGSFVGLGQTGNFYPTYNPSGYTASGFVTGISGYLKSLIQASNAGVSSLTVGSNILSGGLTLTGANNISVTNIGSTITISGIISHLFVENFGAKGDGVTNDNQAIQNAINSGISLGRAVIEFQPKTYNLSGTGLSLFNQINPSGGSMNTLLGIYSANPNLELYFNGNGAILQSNYTGYHDTGLNSDQQDFAILRITSNFQKLCFDSLDIVNNIKYIPTGDIVDQFAEGVWVTPLTSTPASIIYFNNCDLINCHPSYSTHMNLAIPLSGQVGIINEFTFNKCNFLYPWGSAQTGVEPAGYGGSQGAQLSPSVLNHNLYDCNFDGCVGGMLPSGVAFPKDGHIIGGCVNHTIKGGSYKHYDVEGLQILPQFGLGWISGQVSGATQYTGFYVPPVGSGISVVIGTAGAQYQYYNTFTTGEIVRIVSQYLAPFYGVYKVTGWNAGTFTLGITRIQDTDYNSNPFFLSASGSTGWYAPVGTFVPQSFNGGYGNYITQAKYDTISNTIIENCSFVTGPVTTSSGTDLPNSILGRPAPCVVVSDTNTLISNCEFAGWATSAVALNGYGSYLYCNPPTQVVENCNFYIDDSWAQHLVTGFNIQLSAISIGQASYNTRIINNTFVSETSSGCFQMINVNGEFHVIEGNTFRINNPTPFAYTGQGGLYNHATSCLTYGNSQVQNGWRNFVHNNFNFGFDYSVASFGTQNIAQDFYGEPLIGDGYGVVLETITRPFQPTYNGWVRVGMGISNLNAGISCSYRVGGLELHASVNDGGWNQSLVATNTLCLTGPNGVYYPISQARLLGNYQENYVDIYVNDAWTFIFDERVNYGYSSYLYAESLHGGVIVPTNLGYSQLAHKIANNATSGAVVTSLNHQLNTSGVVYFGGTNTTPSISGNVIVQVIDANTFIASGYASQVATNITITQSGLPIFSGSRTFNNSINPPSWVASIYVSGGHGLVRSDAVSISGLSDHQFDCSGLAVFNILDPTGFQIFQGAGNFTGAYTGTMVNGGFIANSGQGFNGYIASTTIIPTTTALNTNLRPAVNGISVALNSDLSSYVLLSQTGSFAGLGYVNSQISSLNTIISTDNTNLQNQINTITGVSGSFLRGNNFNWTPTVTGSSFTFGTNALYVYTGAAVATGTFPSINTCTGRTFFVKNRGGGNLTVTGAGADQLFFSGAILNLVLTSGQSHIFANDGNYWEVM